MEREYRTDYTARKNEVCLIKESPFFTVNILELDCGMQRELTGMDSFIIYMCVEGSCSIKVRENGERVRLNAGNSCLIPAAIAHCDIVPDGMCRMLETYIKNEEAPINPPEGGRKVKNEERRVKN